MRWRFLCCFGGDGERHHKKSIFPKKQKRKEGKLSPEELAKVAELREVTLGEVSLVDIDAQLLASVTATFASMHAAGESNKWKTIKPPSSKSLPEILELAWRVDKAEFKNPFRATFARVWLPGVAADDAFRVMAASLPNRPFIRGDRSITHTKCLGRLDETHVVHWGGAIMPTGMSNRGFAFISAQFSEQRIIAGWNPRSPALDAYVEREVDEASGRVTATVSQYAFRVLPHPADATGCLFEVLESIHPRGSTRAFAGLINSNPVTRQRGLGFAGMGRRIKELVEDGQEPQGETVDQPEAKVVPLLQYKA